MRQEKWKEECENLGVVVHRRKDATKNNEADDDERSVLNLH